MAEQKKSLFFDCPNCDSKEKVIGTVRDEEIAKGKFGKDFPMGSRKVVLPIADLRRPSLSCPVVMIIWDICAKCGFESIREVHYGTGQPQMMRQDPSRQGGRGPSLS